MTNNLDIIRNFMLDNELEYLLVNSTNEFLVEYNDLDKNSRYKITNFSGSTGDALVTNDNVYLFVDGRYHIQADEETDDDITVIKLNNTQNQNEEIVRLVPSDKILGIFSKKNSLSRVNYFSKHLSLKLLDIDPLDNSKLVSDNVNVVLGKELTGLSQDEKFEVVRKNLNDNECLFVTNLEEVSYIFNMRNFSKNYSAKIFAKALISKDESLLFNDFEQDKLNNYLKTVQKTILFDSKTINAFDYNLIKDKAKPIENNIIQDLKSQKTEAELNHLKLAFEKSDKALSNTRQYIMDNENISENAIAKYLEQEFRNQGAKNLSFKSIVARNKNSALAHYSKSSKDEIISDGDLVLIDCGAYFDGGLATDMTRVFVKGTPTQLHKKIYTLVLKAFLLAYNYSKTTNNTKISGFEIDKLVHEFFNSQNLDGFVFNHGLGHGIGINVHEYPPKLSTHEISKVEIKDGMCFSIEPGLYKEGFFGVRLENSCYYKDGEIKSFSQMCFENKLIDFDNLTDIEKNQLAEFEVI